MFLDALLKLADAITVGSSTAAVVSTSYVDTVARGDDYAGCFLLSDCVTAVSSGTTTCTVQFKLQHSDSTAATSFVDLVASPAFAQTSTIAGFINKLRIPPGTKRYIQAATVTTQVTTSGTVTQYIVKDVPVNMQFNR